MVSCTKQAAIEYKFSSWNPYNVGLYDKDVLAFTVSTILGFDEAKSECTITQVTDAAGKVSTPNFLLKPA
jgi:hypothetical protein